MAASHLVSAIGWPTLLPPPPPPVFQRLPPPPLPPPALAPLNATAAISIIMMVEPKPLMFIAQDDGSGSIFLTGIMSGLSAGRPYRVAVGCSNHLGGSVNSAFVKTDSRGVAVVERRLVAGAVVRSASIGVYDVRAQLVACGARRLSLPHVQIVSIGRLPACAAGAHTRILH